MQSHVSVGLIPISIPVSNYLHLFMVALGENVQSRKTGLSCLDGMQHKIYVS